MTPVVVEGTRRARVLAHLAVHPGLTAGELARALGQGNSLYDLLYDMRRKGHLVTAQQWRAQQARHVSLWYAAPPGTVPALPAERAEHQRRRDREAQRRRRARARAAAEAAAVPVPASSLPPGAACKGADPALFFGAEGETPEERQAREEAARAICARCPVRSPCYDLAIAVGDRWGIFGGLNPEERQSRRSTA